MISADFLPYVFDRFRQADGTTTRSHGGLGLGLAIVRYLVEMHNGTIYVVSDGDGKGATFTVQLPLIDSQEVQPSEEKERYWITFQPLMDCGCLWWMTIPIPSN